jgi:DNA-binding XRE family transcriptional regulator
MASWSSRRTYPVDYSLARSNDPAVPSLSSRRKDPALISLGDAIRTFRVSKGYTQEQLAHLAGVDRTYFGDVERGNNSISILQLVRIATALEVTAGELLIAAAL